MRIKKANKRVVELSIVEAKLLRTALMHFRNKVLNASIASKFLIQMK